MVLTDRQRADLHAGIYEYLRSLPPEFAPAADAFAQADPTAAAGVVVAKEAKTPSSSSSSNGRTTATATSSKIPLLEKKWTAIPRLQKKVLELERLASQQALQHAHRASTASSSSTDRRRLPRLPAAHTLQGHAGSVTCLALHPVYTMVVSGSEDGTIKVWDHESGEYMRTLKGHTNTVHAVAFSPTGSHLVSCSSDLSLKLWDMANEGNYSCVRTLRGHDHTISSVRFLPPPPSADTTNNNTTTKNATTPVKSTNATGLEVAVTGATYILSASRDTTVKLWDMETGFCEHTYTDHSDWVRCLAVRSGVTAAAGASTWASSGNDQVIYVYDYTHKERAVELRGHEHVVESLAFLTQDPRPNRGSNSLSHHKPANADAVDYLVSGGRDRSVRLWKLASASCVAVFAAHENWVRSVVLHPSGQYIVSASDDKTIRVLDIKAQRCLRTLEAAHGHFVTSLDLHATLPVMVSGSVDATLKCWTLD